VSLLLPPRAKPRAVSPARRRSRVYAFWGYALTLLFAVSAGGLLARAPAPAAAPRPAPAPFAPGLERAYAVAYHPPGPRPLYVYVACPSRVIRYRVGPDGEVIVTGYASSQTPSARSAAATQR
jgi:hypothetical protein